MPLQRIYKMPPTKNSKQMAKEIHNPSYTKFEKVHKVQKCQQIYRKLIREVTENIILKNYELKNDELQVH